MNSFPRPTLRDVARIAGVSHMTVSRVVRGDRVVSEKTGGRVRAAIEQLGYRADPALSALAAYRTRAGGRGSALAFLACEISAYGQRVFLGAKEEAERLGYSLEFHPLPAAGRGQARLASQLYHRGIRGLLIGPSQEPRTFQGWNWDAFAAVSLSALFHQPEFHAVTTDYFSGATRAVEYLLGQGVRRPGLAISAGLEARTNHRWLGGYLAALGDRKAYVFRGNVASRTALKNWMRKNRLDGLITIHSQAWESRPSPTIPTIFLTQYGCPPGVPCLAYDSRTIGVEGVRLIHHQMLNHEFGRPAETKVLSLQPVFRAENSSPDRLGLR